MESSDFQFDGGPAGLTVPWFLCGYLLFMIPTYLLPWFGSNSISMHLLVHLQAPKASGQFGLFTVLHLAALLALVLFAAGRGRANGRGYLLVFPLLAGAFDMVPGLSLIPFVPTVFHVFTLALGASRRD